MALNINKNAAYGQKVASINLLRAEMKARAPFVSQLAKHKNVDTLRLWRQEDPLLDEMIKLVRDGNEFFESIKDMFDD